MNKVLKHGNKITIKKFNCPECGCVFIIDSKDKNVHLDKTGVIVKCLECNSKMRWYSGENYISVHPVVKNSKTTSVR